MNLSFEDGFMAFVFTNGVDFKTRVDFIAAFKVYVFTLLRLLIIKRLNI